MIAEQNRAYEESLQADREKVRRGGCSRWREMFMEVLTSGQKEEGAGGGGGNGETKASGK